jgi:TBC1 domain family member 2
VDDQLGFDEDEDEFGLPSVASSRRTAKRAGKTAMVPRDVKSQPKKDTPRLSGIGSPGKLGPDVSDIAELRGGPTYPSTSKPAGKILRPQYKEILRGTLTALLGINWMADT